MRGAGAYICGEETGLLESLEGKKGQPRKKPPFPAQYGAFGMPTTVNNVETFCHVPHIVKHGAEWFRGFGTEKSPGTTIFGVSGHVVQRRVSTSCRSARALDEIVFQHAGGAAGGRKVKGVIPGGMSMPILPAASSTCRWRTSSCASARPMLGTGGIMVMDETTCMVRVGCVITYFFRDESCGQCTQCREGTGWLHKIIQRIERGAGSSEDLDILLDVAGKMEGQTICAFADAAAWPVQGLLRHFRDDFEAHVRERKCPFPAELRAVDDAEASPSTASQYEVAGRAHHPAGARRPRPADERRRRPALLLAPEALDRRLAAGSVRSRSRACRSSRSPATRRSQDGMEIHTAERAREEGARRRDGAAARQPPARLPDLRPGRRVQAAGLRVRVRRRRTRARRSRGAR